MKQLLIALDIGSTNLKAQAFDTQGHEVCSAKRLTPFMINHEGVYYSSETLWGRAAEALRELTSKCEGEIKAIAITGFGNDGIPLDRDGKEVYPFISWKCSRTMPQFERFMAEFGRKRMFDCTGMQSRPIDAIYKLMWLKEHHPECMDRMHSFLMVEDYINFRLTGERVSDHTVSFTSGLYDPATQSWSKEVADAAGLPLDMMSPVLQSGTVIGKVSAAASRETGLPEGTKVVLGGWDITCSSFALGGFRKGALMDIMGSWETLMPCAGSYYRNDTIYNLGLNACHHVAKGKFAYPVYFVSSSIVEWYLGSYYGKKKDELTDVSLYRAFIEDAMNAPPGCRGAMFLPHIYGSAAPIVDGRSRGAFIGLNEFTGKPEMARAVLEGLSQLCRQVLAGCSGFMEDGIENIIVCGGGSRNSEWCRIKADVCGKDIQLSSLEESTALGAALKAGVGAGIYADDDQAVDTISDIRSPIRHDPEKQRVYAVQGEVYDQLYTALRDINRHIYDLNL